MEVAIKLVHGNGAATCTVRYMGMEYVLHAPQTTHHRHEVHGESKWVDRVRACECGCETRRIVPTIGVDATEQPEKLPHREHGDYSREGGGGGESGRKCILAGDVSRRSMQPAIDKTRAKQHKPNKHVRPTRSKSLITSQPCPGMRGLGTNTAGETHQREWGRGNGSALTGSTTW